MPKPTNPPNALLGARGRQPNKTNSRDSRGEFGQPLETKRILEQSAQHPHQASKNAVH
jgi:hypothetical protein